MTELLNTKNFDRGYQKSGQSNEIGYYEERLSKRREKEKEEKKLNEFLNNSLRASERLKALEKAKRINYKINPGFVDEGWEGDSAIDVAGLTDALCNRKNMKLTLPRSDLEWLQGFVRRDVFQASYGSCTALLAILTKYDCAQLSGSGEAGAHLGSVTSHISGTHKKTKESHYKFQMQELLQILSTPELQGLCEANDACVGLVDVSRKQRREANLTEPLVAGTSVDAKALPREVSTRPAGINSRPVPSTRTKTMSIPNQESTRIIQSPMKGCYAQLHPSDKGIPLKTVVLEKGTQPLGATVRNEREAVVVGRIVVGGVAHKSGLLKEGDELLSVNGIELTGKDVNEVSDILARMTGTLKFTVASVDESSSLAPAQPPPTTMIHLRSLYTYNPEDDVYIPCKDIGLGFDRGDILHITNVQDPNWWQAYKDGEGSMVGLAGLVPSPDYQYQREMLRKQLSGDNDSVDIYASGRPESSILCLKKHKKNYPGSVNGGWIYNVDVNGRASNTDSSVAGRKRKHNKKGNRATYCPRDMELNHPDPNINTYEEVQMFLPQPHRKRPVVFVGPDQIGRDELVKMLLASDQEQFCLVKQHTTLEGRSADHRIVTKEEFKHLQNQEEFLETAIFEKNWYGTGRTEVKATIDSGKTAVLTLQPESLHTIRKTAFLPYVIFVSPPSKIEALRNLRQHLKQERLSDDDLFVVINRAKMIDFKFGHMFDAMIIIDSLEKAVSLAVSTIGRLDTEPQWVPSRWLVQRPTSHLP